MHVIAASRGRQGEHITKDSLFGSDTGSRSGMYAALDGKTHHLIYAAYGVNEGLRDLLSFCQGLKQRGLNP